MMPRESPTHRPQTGRLNSAIRYAHSVRVGARECPVTSESMTKAERAVISR